MVPASWCERVTSDSIETLLFFHAVRSGAGVEVQDAIRNGQDVNARNEENGDTPLIMAAEFGFRGVCDALLAGGANVNAYNVDGATPLLIAALKGHLDVGTVLFAAGANINAANLSGAMPLLASVQEGHLKVCTACCQQAHSSIQSARVE